MDKSSSEKDGPPDDTKNKDETNKFVPAETKTAPKRENVKRRSGAEMFANARERSVAESAQIREDEKHESISKRRQMHSISTTAETPLADDNSVDDDDE